MTDETYEITLDKFIYGGEAMGRLPDPDGGGIGRAVFVPFALPGERVRISLTFQKRGFARGKLLEVLEDSPERIPPKCPHFGGCGHCSYQHIPYESQLRAKEEILRDQLIRIGKKFILKRRSANISLAAEPLAKMRTHRADHSSYTNS